MLIFLIWLVPSTTQKNVIFPTVKHASLMQDHILFCPVILFYVLASMAAKSFNRFILGGKKANGR